MDLVFKDFFMIDPPSNSPSGHSSDPDVREAASSTKGLRVVMTASHAGKLTKNFTLYPPSTFQRNSHTFVTPYQKPVQTHHSDKSDPIGRIIGARYIPYQANDFSDNHKGVFLKFQDMLSQGTILDSIKFLQESGVLFEDGWKGLGELELEAVITDQLAIEKILDGRYNTVSVGMHPHQAYCSRCNKDWLENHEPCEHDKGERDEEGVPMFLISGDVTGMEVSYINHPANPNAFNKEIGDVSVEQTPTQPPLEPLYPIVDSADGRNVTYEILDSFDHEAFGVPGKKVEEKEKGQLPDDVTSPEEEMSVTKAVEIAIEDSENLTDEMSQIINLVIEDAVLTARARKRLKSQAFCGPGRSYPSHDRSHGANALARVKQHGSPSLQKRVRACVCRKFPSLPACKRGGRDENLEWDKEIIDELDQIIKHPLTGVPTTLGQYIFGVEDALTEEDLNKLPDSVFCGPNRSFHIISVDHYEAAKELLNSYQGKGDAMAIADKLEKSKENLEKELLDATTEEEKEGIQDSEEKSQPKGNCLLDGLDDTEIVTLFLDMERELVSRKIRAPRQCYECESKDKEKEVLQDQVKELETTAGVLRKEVKIASNDCTAADNALTELNGELEAVYRDCVSKYTTLVEKDKKEEDVEASVKEMDLQALKEAYVELNDKMDSVTEFVRSGLTKEVDAEESVKIEDAEEVEEEEEDVQESKYSEHEMALFGKLQRFSDDNKQFAETHLLELKMANKISRDLTLDQICDIVKQVKS